MWKQLPFMYILWNVFNNTMEGLHGFNLSKTNRGFRPYKNVFWHRYWLSIKEDSMYVGVNVLQHVGMGVQTNCPMIFFWGIPLLSNRRWVGCNILLPTYWKYWHSFLIRFIVAKFNWNCVYRRHVTYIHMFIGDILLMGLIIVEWYFL